MNDRTVPRILAATIALAGALALGAGLLSTEKNASRAQRSFVFTYQVHVPPVPGESLQSHLWIPLPQSDEYQSISKLIIESRVEHKTGTESEYGNSYAVFSPESVEAAAGYDVTLRFEVTRREYRRELRATGEQPPQAKDPMLKRYLQPDKMVPLNATIAELARVQTEGIAAPLERALKIYNYVVSTMHYDKSGEGWGRGDEMWACDSKRGNCTDFHSVLIGMMRSSGIPARFEIGFPLPAGQAQGDVPGYHCWAEFYLDRIGWVPVDASEASRNPAKRDYFFGAVDADRVRFTYGRDIRLSPEQTGDPLNFFIYPYAEADGKPVKDLKTHFAFKDLAPPRAASSGN